jgi:hypothetical protein
MAGAQQPPELRQNFKIRISPCFLVFGQIPVYFWRKFGWRAAPGSGYSSMEESLFDLFGLKVPFVLAAATYGVFFWLDSNASDEATQVISLWLRGRSQHRPDLGNLIINAFDRIYTSPLLRFRAFRRSATISSIIWLIVVYFAPSFKRFITDWNSLLVSLVSPESLGIWVIMSELIMAMLITVWSDYFSLLFVRRYLSLARIYPIKASIMSPMVGLLLVVLNFIFFLSVTEIIISLFDQPKSISADLLIISRIIPPLATVMAPALIVHLWLPLFALSSLAVKMVFLIFRAVEWAQWFLKQGDAHPFKAIGVLATIIVFGSAMLVKEAWTYL